MSLIDTIPEELGVANSWTETGGVLWLTPGPLSVRDLAKTMNMVQARFITITAVELPGEEGFRLEYHWDLDGTLLGFPFTIALGQPIDSIYDLCEAVDWIEREIHEGYAIDFAGRVYDPLLLREGQKLGVNLRKEAE